MGSTHILNFIPIRPALSELQTWKFFKFKNYARERARRLPASDYLKGLDWWVSIYVPDLSTIGWAISEL